MGNQAALELSVVIGFRDWGLERLDLALRSHRDSTAQPRMEVIVVDYGSKDPGPVADVTDAHGVRLCRADVRGRWSRSHALNIGIREATAPLVLTTDADVLFAPRTVETILSSIEQDRDFILVQCRDLPDGLQNAIRELDFAVFEAHATLRPPWGTGGCACFRRDLAFELRGFDERMEWYGGEDNDFVQRAIAHGETVRWLDNPEARYYHIWHPKETDSRASDASFVETVERNRKIVLDDPTIVRNAFAWGAKTPTRPTVSVCIATYNRAVLLAEAVRSVLQQTWSDFELLILDDGSTDGTGETVRSFDDPRIRYVEQPHRGIPAARNAVAAHAKGDYLCIVDDDDVQLPDRLDRHLAALEDGYVGNYGGWIDFSEEQHTLTHNPGKPHSLEALLFSGKVMTHATTMILRRVVLEHPYNEHVLFGSDYDAALRVAAHGYRLKHVGAYVMLRRLHSVGVTSAAGQLQRKAGAAAAQKLIAHLSADEVAEGRRIAVETKPLVLADPLEEPGVLRQLPYYFTRLSSIAKARRESATTKAPTLQSTLGTIRPFERVPTCESRLEVGPFATHRQASFNVPRLQTLSGDLLTIERVTEKGVERYFVVWPWRRDAIAWDLLREVVSHYLFPAQVGTRSVRASCEQVQRKESDDTGHTLRLIRPPDGASDADTVLTPATGGVSAPPTGNTSEPAPPVASEPAVSTTTLEFADMRDASRLADAWHHYPAEAIEAAVDDEGSLRVRCVGLGDERMYVSFGPGPFARPPALEHRRPMAPNRNYVARLDMLALSGDLSAKLWVIEYDSSTRLCHTTCRLVPGTNTLELTSSARTECFRVAVRFAGRGTLCLRPLQLEWQHRVDGMKIVSAESRKKASRLARGA